MTVNPTDFNQTSGYSMDFESLTYSAADNPGTAGKSNRNVHF